MPDRIPKDKNGQPRRRTNLEVVEQAIKDKLKIGHGLRGKQLDNAADEITRRYHGQTTDSNN